MELIKPVTVADAAAAFTRANSANYWDKTGTLKTAVANVLRMSYDPMDLGAAPQPLIEPTATNLIAYSSNLTQWTGSALASLSGSFFGSLPYYAVTKTNSSTSEFRQHYVGAKNAGQTVVATLALRAGTTDLVTVGLYDWTPTNNGWGSAADSQIEIDGPGTAYAQTGGAFYISGLSASEDTLITLTRVYQLDASSTALLIYPGTVNSSTIGHSVQATRAQVELDRATSYIQTNGSAVTRLADAFDTSTGTGLLYSNVVENDTDDGPLWSAAATYTTGQTVRRPNHRKYYALQAVPVNKTPEDNTGGTTPYWQDVGPTSTWSVFDATYSTIADAPDYVTYILRPGEACTGLAVVGIVGASVRVTAVDPVSGVTVYNKVTPLRLKNSRSISDYLFGEIEYRTDAVFDDMPPFKSAIVTVTVGKLGSTAAIGDIQFGRLVDIGNTQWKPEIRTLRRSLIADDGFGNIKFTKRRSSKLITADVSVDTDRADYVVRMLDGFTDEPCVIIGDARWTSLIVIGFVQDFRLVLENDGADGALYNVQIQGFA